MYFAGGLLGLYLISFTSTFINGLRAVGSVSVSVAKPSSIFFLPKYDEYVLRSTAFPDESTC